MKWSTTLALAVSPVAMAISDSDRLRSAHPVNLLKRGRGHSSKNRNSIAAVAVPNRVDPNNGIIVLWVNPGGSAQTTFVQEKVTVTETVAAGQTQQTAVSPVGVEAPPSAITPSAQQQQQQQQQQGETPAVGGSQGAAAATHTVKVGGPAGLTYQPDQIRANVGDTVVWEFYSKNHTATQSTFDKPCEVMQGGFDSGFVPNSDNALTPPPQMAMQIMISSPLWFYCKQSTHCGKGMTFSINPTDDKTQALFQSRAIQQYGKGAATGITDGAGQQQQPAAGGTPGSAPSQEAVTQPGGAGQNGSGVKTGQGTVGADGTCTCVVTCGANGFPDAAQGVNAVGGFAGNVPMMSMMRSKRSV